MKKRLHELGQLIVACETYIIQDDKVLMHKRADDKKKFPGFWIGPGGHVDEDEDVLTTAIREVKEETGIEISQDKIKLKVLAFHHHIDINDVWIEYLFRATLDSEQKIHSSSEGKSLWVKTDSLLTMDNVFPPSKYYFDHILNDKPGILYNNSQWKNSRLVKVLSERKDKDY